MVRVQIPSMEEQKSNSNTVWFNFQTFIIFSVNLVSLVTLRSSGTVIWYGCHLLLDVCIIYFISCDCIMNSSLSYTTAGNRHKQNSWFCKEIREDNSRFWWRRVHEYASQGMYMSKIEIFFFTARILQNQRMLCCGECFHD